MAEKKIEGIASLVANSGDILRKKDNVPSTKNQEDNDIERRVEERTKKLEEDYNKRIAALKASQDKNKTLTKEEKTILNLINDDQFDFESGEIKTVAIYPEIHERLNYYRSIVKNRTGTKVHLQKYVSAAILEKLHKDGHLKGFKEYQNFLKSQG